MENTTHWCSSTYTSILKHRVIRVDKKAIVKWDLSEKIAPALISIKWTNLEHKNSSLFISLIEKTKHVMKNEWSCIFHLASSKTVLSKTTQEIPCPSSHRKMGNRFYHRMHEWKIVVEKRTLKIVTLQLDDNNYDLIKMGVLLCV